MHPAAFNFVRHTLEKVGPRRVVLEYGGRNVNGSIRGLFGSCDYTSIDIVSGPGVDIVADAARFVPETQPDTVVCTEVLEHSTRWADIVRAAGRVLESSGLFICTCACEPRAPHSAIDGGYLRDFEAYNNVDPNELSAVLHSAGFEEFDLEVDSDAGDLRVVATKAP